MGRSGLLSGLPGYGQSRQCCWDRMATVGAGIGAVGGHLRRDLGRAVVVVAVASWAHAGGLAGGVKDDLVKRLQDDGDVGRQGV